MNSPILSARATWVPPVLQQPFRVMFLCASGFASAGMFFWVLFLHLGWLPAASLPPVEWHGHEMLFGFAGALAAGFLLTALAEWTRLATITPAALVLLATVWLAARVLFLLPTSLPYAVTATIDCGFFALLLFLVGRPILKSRNRRNYFVIGLLSAILLADIAFHLSVTGTFQVPANRVLYWVIDLFTVLMLAIGGRVIPFFTGRRLASVTIRRYLWLDWSVNGGAALLAVFDILLPGSSILGAFSLVVAALVVLRWWNWQPWKTLHEPMLWVLHLGYLWLAAGLMLRGAALLTGALPEITALHAVTVGAIGSLAIGMMTRVTLGHTGHAMAAGPFMTAAFATVNVAAVLRLTGTSGLLPIAGTLWTLAFAVYFVRFLPIMIAPRKA
jgi:uncharacterized protein involved in response to NO